MSDGFILEGDCLDLLQEMVDEGLTVQSVICDPPYGLSFMGRYWDHNDNIAFHSNVWRLCFDLLPPGGHLVAFGGTRTYHRLVCAVEDAGFEIRDQLAWVYGTGFPKSLDVSKAIDKAAGAEREIVGSKLGMPGYSLATNDTDQHERRAYGKFTDAEKECAITAPATAEARQWQGWGTALKPAWEPIVLARKPLAGTVVENVLAHTTGGLNIDACRIASYDSQLAEKYASVRNAPPRNNAIYGSDNRPRSDGRVEPHANGRFPANFVHDGSHEVLDVFGNRGDCSASAARFFYCAKAGKKERDESSHPTVKPLALMQWLVRLVTPPDGIVLDPFAGTGTTGEAAHLEGFSYILIEREVDYVRDIERRLSKYGMTV